MRSLFRPESSRIDRPSAAASAGRACAIAGALACLALSTTARATCSTVAGDIWTFSIQPPANAHVIGCWGPVVDTPDDGLPDGHNGYYHPLYGIHAALLRDSQLHRTKLMLFRDEVLVYDLDSPGGCYIMNLRGDNGHLVVPHEPMCGGYATTAEGKLLIVGGRLYHFYPQNPPWAPVTTGWVSLFDPTGSLSWPTPPYSDPPPLDSAWHGLHELPDASGANSGCDATTHGTGRYYPTLTELDNGKVLLTAGSFWWNCNGDNFIDDNEITNLPTWAIYDPLSQPNPPNYGWTLDGLAGGSFQRPWPGVLPLYPHMKVLPCGLFFAGEDNAYQWPDVHTQFPSYVWSSLGDGAGWSTTPLSQVGKLRNRGFGNCVLLTLDATQDRTPVLMIGGGDFHWDIDDQNAGSKGAELIRYHADGTVTAPGWVYTGAMKSSGPRWNCNSVVLPDGKVLTIGGDMGDPDPPGTTIPDPAENHTCELYTPGGPGTWALMADLPLSPNPPLPPADPYVHRGHHSTALLLPDGRVVSAAHEIEARDDRYQKNYVVYYPPYLWDANEQPATRPVIQAGPTAGIVNYGLPFEINVDYPSAISEVALMRPGAPTHGVDFSARRVLLHHSVDPTDAHRVIVSGPRDSTYAPPGDYMLFVLASGVPSVATWVNVQRGGSYAASGPNPVRWGGDVWLDRDFLVQTGGTLIIEPGTHVHALAGTDRGNQGNQSTKVELVVKGQVLMNGTASQRVTLTSFSPTNVQAQGDWGGILFLDDQTDTRVSMLAYPEIDYATRGVQVDTLACDLIHPTFNISGAGNYQIYLDRDTRLAEGHEWNLDAPCAVTVAAKSDASGRGEAANRVELTVSGAIRTQRPPGGSGSVVFTPTQLDADGDDWYGLTVFGDGFHDGVGVAQIQDADFGYAQFPLTFFAADAPQVVRTHFHHYAKDAVTDYASNATIGNCRMDGTLASSFALNGIHIYDSFATATTDTVLFQATNGIWIEKAKTECLSPPGGGSPAGTVTVTGATIVGRQPPLPNSTGILAKWICGSMVVSLSGNDVQRWNTGLRMVNSADVSATCNCVKSNKIGLDHRRDILTTNDDHGINRSLQNNLQNDSLNVIARAGVAVPGHPDSQSTAGFHLGVVGESASGQNRLMIGSLGQNRFNYSMETGPYGQGFIARWDSAHVNTWYDAAGALLTTESAIQGYNLAEPPQVIQVNAFNPGDPTCSTSTCDITGLSAAMREGRQTAAAGVDREPSAPPPRPTGVAREESSPTVFRLGVPRPTPSSSGVVVDFDVPSPGGDRVDLAVYDVRGRRLRTLQHGALEAGRHSFAWDLRDESDARIAAGVYFVRVISPRYTRVEKLVVLR